MKAPEVDLAWRSGNTAAAIEAADRILAAGADENCLAAGVAAAAAAADGSLLDAAARWRVIATALTGAPSVAAQARAALAACLGGDVEAADRDLAAAREQLSGAAPRGLTVFLDGVDAAIEAVRGGFDRAARRLAGLAAATVPVDGLAAEQWDDLAVTVLIAGGDDRTAQEVLAAHEDRPPTSRRRLLAAWLHLRAGRLSEARAAIASAGGAPVLRRDAVLAAAVTIGLARRTGDADALRATWRRVAPVVAGADVEVLLLDAWGELSVGAAAVSRFDGETVVEAMTCAIAKAGVPQWALHTNHWWRLHRAVGAGDGEAATQAAVALQATERGPVAHAWASVVRGDVNGREVAAVAAGLDDAWEAMALCGAAAAKLGDPAEARELLSTGRTLRARFATEEPADGLSKRERSVGELLLDGLTQKEIGARLYISPKTVEQHVARIRQKLAVSSRAELMASLRSRLAG
ncbi:helix-turn-helix transcriptional regulator [Lentzea nigeriaca]|uniref:helix-turn-helix transcriptional regulator n=1 Tax=Lentzea nigeriaca TaxID=1128665 RepID=UPI00195D6368|nr:LuxR family transcriptional regulator [Lentzea nigeriaca]MBM7858651.1 DNA-binding CsgD family transcriptional regulator [Lentzea nigeriaca]